MSAKTGPSRPRDAFPNADSEARVASETPSPSTLTATDVSPLAGSKAILMILAVTGSTFLNVFLGGAMTVAVPSIGRDLHFKQSDLTWPTQAYNLAYGCLLLLTGSLADKYGRRNVFLLGASWFVVFSIPPIFAPNPAVFNTFMGLLGLGAAAMTSSGIGLVGGHLAGATKHRAVAVLAGGQSVGFIVGLVSAGFLCELYRGWRYIFVLQAALCGTFILIAVYSVPKDTIMHDREMDWPGVILSTSGLVLLIFSLSQSQSVGWWEPYIPTLFALSIALLAGFIYWEHKTEARDEPVLVSLRIFRGYRFAAFFSMILFVWWSFNVQEFFVTLYYQDVQLLSPSKTGIRFIPESLAGIVLNTLCGYLVEFAPAQWLNGFGISCLVASACIFATIETSVSYWRNAFLIMILIPGADTTFIVGNLFTINAVDERDQALAGGLFSTATRISTAFGLAISNTVAQAVTKSKDHSIGVKGSTPSTLLAGYHATGWLCVACAVLGLGLNFAALTGLGVVGGKKGGSITQRETTEKPPGIPSPMTTASGVEDARESRTDDSHARDEIAMVEMV